MKAEPADNHTRERTRSESETSRFAVDVEAMTLLYEIGNQCVDITRGFEQCLEAILDAAVHTLRAQKGTIQLLDPQSGVLKIVVHRGFHAPFLRFFAKLSTKDPACCRAALSSRRRVIIEDIASSPVFADQPARGILLNEGMHALQSTPLISSSGHVMGTLSTHFRQRPVIGERQLRFMDLLARQAADYVERKRAEKALRDHEAQLEADRAALIRMHALSAKRIENLGVQPLLQEVIDTAVAIVNADKGTVRLLESGKLRLLAHHGHSRAFLQHFADAETVASVSRETTKRGERTLVEDVEQSAIFAGTESLRVLRQARVRAIQSTPLITRTGRLLGTLTTQWSRPHRPDTRDLWRLDLLARQATDLIESAQAEEALRQAHAQLEDRALHLEKLVNERTSKLREMINELEQVSYAIVHDMRAPLRAMNTFAEMVLHEISDKPGIPTPVPDHCQRIINAAARLDKLIQDSLNYTKAVLQEGALQPVDLSRLIPGLLESYPNLQPDKADISIEGDLPTVLGEESLLTQCFSNLLGNAVKFVPPGVRPQVRIRTEGAHRFARISVEDNGIGIPKEGQKRVFRMFERLTHDYEGTGIGLAIVRKVVQRMGGKVGVESELGKGSHFWVDLRTPLAEKGARPQTGHPGSRDG